MYVWSILFLMYEKLWKLLRKNVNLGFVLSQIIAEIVGFTEKGICCVNQHFLMLSKDMNLKLNIVYSCILSLG